MPLKSLQQVTVRAGEDGALPKPAGAAEWRRLVRAMRRDPTIALARQIIIAPVLAAEWSYEATDDAPDGAVDAVEAALEGHRLHLLRNIMRGFLDFGWQAFETTHRIDDQQRAVYEDFKPLLQDLTEILVDEHGAIIGLAQPDDEITLGLDEFVIFSHDVEGTDWYGQAIMRNVEMPYLSHLDADASARRYDTKVSGAHWVVYYPTSPGETMFNGALTPNYDIALNILNRLESNAKIAIPRSVDEMVSELASQRGVDNNSWKIELISDDGAGVTSFVERMKYLDGLKVRGLGLPERSLLEGQYGTKAEAGEHADFAITVMEQRHNEIAVAINRYAVNRTLELNFGTGYEGVVYIRPAPIADAKRAFLQNLYRLILQSQGGFDLVASTIDIEGLQDQLGIPFQPEESIGIDGIDGPDFVVD